MFIRFVLLLLISGSSLLFAENFADRLLEEAATQVAVSPDDPIEMVLLAERIYYLSHESGQQKRIGELLNQLFEAATHGEVRAEIGFLLTQHYRQSGEYDEVERLFHELGSVPEWRVLGPLAPKRDFNLKSLLSASKTQGLDRNIRPHLIRAHGQEDFFSEGIGHYGFFSGNLAVFPNQLAGAMYTTWFYIPEKGDYRLGLGWAHYIKAWINDTVAWEATENQDPHPDQAVVHFNLKKGWHRLTLYIESKSEDPNLGFFARMTTSSGKPVLFEAKSKKKLPKKKPKMLQSETSLVELAHNQSDYALASMIMIKEQKKHASHGSPHDLLKQAYAKDPNRFVAEKLVSQIEDTNTTWQLLVEFLEQERNDLDRAWGLTQLGQIALNQERYWQARAYSDKALAANPEYWPAVILRNNVFSRMGLTGEALNHALELDKAYPNVPWISMDLSDLFFAMKLREQARIRTDNVLAMRHGNVKFSLRKIKLLKSTGETEALDAFFTELMKDAPYSVGTLEVYIDFLAANDRFDQAETLLEKALDQLPENPVLLEAMGSLKMKSSRPGALTYLEKALALKPQNPTLEKMIALSKAGQAAFYESYRVVTAPDVFIREVSPIVINIDNTVCKVSANGQSSVYRELEYEVLTEQGLKELPGYAFSYSPLRQKAEIVKAEIIRDGRTIHLTRFGRNRISDPAYRMYYDLVSYQIPFIGLEVGDIVRVEHRTDEFKSGNIFGDYFGDLQFFTNRYPTKRMTYTLILPEDMEIHRHVEKMEPAFSRVNKAGNTAYTWTLDGVSPFESESRMPGLEGYMPYVAVSTFKDWQSMAAWYKNLIKDQLTLDVETKKIVAELIQGITDPLEIVKRIHEYVVTNTRYVALEFGIHGYKPYQVNQVNTRQFGDCKDKASLIVSMMREAGIEANVAIVRTSDKGTINTFPAMLGYFNHAIAYVPQFDLYLDGTAEFSGVRELPTMDQGALTLVVDKDGGGRLTNIPVYDDTRQGYDLDLSVAENGMAEVNGKLSYNGTVNPELRQYLSIDARLPQYLQELMADTVPGLDVRQADRTGQRINEPITLRFTGQSKRLFQAATGELKLPLSILSNHLTQAYAPNVERQFPLDFGAPKTKTVNLNIAVPKGFSPVDLPDSLELSDENFSVTIKLEQIAQAISVNYQVAFKSKRVEPEDYASLREMMQAHDRVLDKTIRFVAE